MSSRATARLSRLTMAHGAIILTLGLLAGFTVPGAARPDTVLAAHVIGITAGAVAIVAGLVLPRLVLPVLAVRAIFWSLVPALYLGFGLQWLGGLVRLSRMFVVTAKGLPEGAPWAEDLVQWVTMAISPLTVIPFALMAWGLFRAPRDTPV